ncbi:cobalamin (vitamin B12) biosynthesis CbiX protein [Parafrankia sp. EAN1pec]|uniref:sirohydrochlorin chelatase n=1 Tax=Parafrankia sp. (strain EAN1pec) TaxID=298653 RepID=UPI00005424F6|nr:cobalamin (vitamin B12) biosynthesis CbiX protein [Frankia sp. EAN1pec]
MRGLLVIGHGSRRAEANATVVELARTLAGADTDSPAPAPGDGSGGGMPTGTPPAWDAVEPAFLEIARPDIAEGYAALVRTGCSEIVAHPFFLFDGNHTSRDIPDALAAAQTDHPGTSWTVTQPLGLHPGVVRAVQARIEDALHQAAAAAPAHS